MSKFRKKPIEIEAEQFFYDREGIPGVFYPAKSEDGKTYIGDAYVVTIHEQRVYLENEDWVIAEPDGEHYYPCKPDIFADRYEDAARPAGHGKCMCGCDACKYCEQLLEPVQP